MSSSLNVTLYKEHGVQLWKWYVQVHVLISPKAPTTGVNWVALETEPCFSSCASCVLVWCKWDSVSPAVVEQVVLASQVCYLSRVTLNFLSPRAQDGGSPSKTPVGLFFFFFLLLLGAILFPNKRGHWRQRLICETADRWPHGFDSHHRLLPRTCFMHD